MNKKTLTIMAILMMVMAGQSFADVTIGGKTYNSVAHADSLSGNSGLLVSLFSVYYYNGSNLEQFPATNTSDLEKYLIDKSEAPFSSSYGTLAPEFLYTGVISYYVDPANAGEFTRFIELKFTDNKIVNGLGSDISIFNMGDPVTYNVKFINSSTNVTSATVQVTSIPVLDVAYHVERPVSVAYFDLSTLGYPIMTEFDKIKIDMTFRGIDYSPLITDVMTTFTPIPAPAALLLGSLGVGVVGWLRRRRVL